MPRRLLLAVCAIAIVPCLFACGGDDDDAAGPESTATSGLPVVANSTASPQLSGPAGKYSVSLDDIGAAWLTDIKGTFEINSPELVGLYVGRSRVFPSAAEGLRMLREWGYKEGYETGYIPEGRDAAVLQGAYYIVIETHLFETPEGAHKAYDYFAQKATEGGASSVAVTGVGNEASGFETVASKIAGSSVNAAFHQVVFRRGNVVEIVFTKGAQGFMEITEPWELARIADEKLVGQRSATEPTPTSNYKSPTPAPKP